MSDNDSSAGIINRPNNSMQLNSERGESDVDSIIKTPIQDASSSDDEPLSVLKEDVRKRNNRIRMQNREDEEEMALAESSSEDESRRDDYVRDYSREGDLELQHVPKVSFPYPSYLHQLTNEMDLKQNPFLSSPMSFVSCQNLQLILSRKNCPEYIYPHSHKTRKRTGTSTQLNPKLKKRESPSKEISFTRSNGHDSEISADE